MGQVKEMPDRATYSKTTSKTGNAPKKNNIYKGDSLNHENTKNLTETTMKKNSGNKGGGRSA